MGALQYVDLPGYAALLLRRTYADLSLPGALMDMADQWLRGTDARWDDKSHTWTFPSGSTLTFGYLEHEADKYRYQGSAFQYIGFDELTHFTETQYQYLFSRLVRPAGSTLPIRMRATSNPGGVGHRWVKERFIKSDRGDRIFVPAGLADNPHVDQEEYRASLEKLDHITREQLLNGNWDISGEGTLFKRQWFEIVDECPQSARTVRCWDMAATEAKPGQKRKDPDWTAGAKLARCGDDFYLMDMRHFRESPGADELLVRQTAQLDGREVEIGMEEEGGSSGKFTSHHFDKLLTGFTFRPRRSTGSKYSRAKLWSSKVEHGHFKIVRGDWDIESFLDEVTAFPETDHDDQVDAVSGAFIMLTDAGEEPRIRDPWAED